MHQTKCELIVRYGTKCMLCGSDVGSMVQWHHIVPRYVFKARGEQPDDSMENGSLLCPNCHVKIHKFKYKDMEYQTLTATIIRNKR
jgi:predicted HNH restriction endonuclease